MIPIIAGILRYVAMSIIQLGGTAALFAIIDPLLEKIKRIIRDDIGLDEDDTTVLIANFLIDAFVAIGIHTGIMKTKLPLKFADKLGLTKAGYKKRPLSKAGQAKVEKVEKEKKPASSTLKTTLKAFGFSFVASIPWMPSLIQNILDQGTFNAQQSNRILDAFGVPQNIRWPVGEGKKQPGSFSKDSFQKYISGLEVNGILGINDPYKLQSLPYSMDNIVDLAVMEYGQGLKIGKKLTEKELIAILAPNLIFGDRPTGVATLGITPAKKITTQIKVFTGVLIQGKLSDAPAFVPREDDLITDMGELNSALQNNVVPFLASLAGRVRYELKVQNTVITKDGTQLYGQTKQVVSGYKKDGEPKYKNVTNKFAVLNLYLWTAKNTRVKIDAIILGPVDSVNFMPDANQINRINENIPNMTTTSDIAEVEKIETRTPITIEPPRVELPIIDTELEATPSTAPDDPQDTQAIAYRGKYYEHNTFREIARPRFGYLVGMPETGSIEMRASASGLKKEYVERFLNAIKEVITPEIEKIKTTTITAASPVVTTPEKAAAIVATNLSEFYNAQDQKLPTVSERAKIYERFFAGQGVYYSGTYDQNTKLLNALKAEL